MNIWEVTGTFWEELGWGEEAMCSRRATGARYGGDFRCTASDLGPQKATESLWQWSNKSSVLGWFIWVLNAHGIQARNAFVVEVRKWWLLPQSSSSPGPTRSFFLLLVSKAKVLFPVLLLCFWLYLNPLFLFLLFLSGFPLPLFSSDPSPTRWSWVRGK